VRGIAPAWRRKDAPPSATWSLSGLASSLRLVAHSMKYAVVERERWYRVAAVPEGVVGTKEISDRYIEGTRLRLREVRELDGEVIRKLGYKVRLSKGPAEVACTNFCLSDQEWSVLVSSTSSRTSANPSRSRSHATALFTARPEARSHVRPWTGVDVPEP
jgi:hypothetical protein